MAPEHLRRLLNSGQPATIRHIFEWGQYQDSRMAAHALAYLAYPEDPGLFWTLPSSADRIDAEDLNPRAAFALASYLTLAARSESEYARALEVFELVSRLGSSKVPEEYHEHFVMAAHLGGMPGRALELAASLTGVGARLAEGLTCQASHPRNGGTVEDFMRRFKRLTGWSELHDLREGESPSIESLRTADVRAAGDGPLISVIMTCYRPDRSLLSAVGSIVEQSWQNWELLLVDDGSGPEYHELLREAVELDSRVRLLIQPENSGTYQARNRAMAVAEGEFVTGLDSDDWAHPYRLEKQVRPLLDSPRLVMVESRSMAVYEDLSPVIDPQIALMASRSTLIMFRAEPVRNHIGFYDEARKTADSEFRMRIKERFGGRAWKRMKGGPLTLVRHTDTTLSAGEVGRYWMTTSRLAYHSGFTYWHRSIRRGRSSAYLRSLARPRPFPICEDITLPGARARAIDYDRVYAADWRKLDDARSALLDEAAASARDGRSIALAHLPDWEDVDGERPLIHQTVLEVASERGLHFVDDPKEAPVVVPSASYRDLYLFERSGLDADRVTVGGLGGRAASPDSVAEVRVRLGRATRVRDLLGRRDAVPALLGLGSVAVVTCSAWVADSSGAAWAGAAAAAVWAAASGAVLAWKAVSRLRP